jgi:peptide/nickel transport system substrate-binding protein
MAGTHRSDPGFERFERFLDEWSRRDFLRGMGGALAFSAFLAGGVELLEACGNQPSAQNVAVKKGGHVAEGSTSDPTTFNYIFITDTASAIPQGLMFASLLNQRGDGALIPEIAKSVPKVESDQLTYKFDLRQDVTWSDGQPLTADDVLFTFNLMFGSVYDYKAINSPNWPDLQQYLESVTAPDKYTVVMKTKVPYAPFLTNYGTLSPLPKHVLEPLALKAPGDFRKIDYNFAPTVVSGPFLFDRWDKSQQVALKANAKHFLGRPNLDSYVIKIVSTSTQIADQLKTGELDVGGIDPSLWDDMATATNINRVSFFGAGWEYFAYNVDPNNPAHRASGKIFGDPATGKMVRQALYHAIDRTKIANAVYFKQADVAYSVEPETSWALTANLPKYPFDLQKAKDMLDQAGWKVGSDGVRTKDGVRFSFEIITSVGVKTREAIVQILSEQWRQIGVDATAKPIQFPEYVKTSTTRDFDMVMGGIVTGVDPDLSGVYHSRTIGHGLNRMGYRSTQLDNLLDKAVQVIDQSKRKPIYAQVQQILMEDVPAAVLVWPRTLAGISKRVQKFGLAPYNRYAARPWAKDIFVTDGK